MTKPTFYITTPLYYPSGKWHLGHSYTTVCCDAIARFKRMSGFDVFYLTGTDEHGQKIAERAGAAGLTPKQFVDALTGEIKDLWKLLDISYDGFIRTTDEYHKANVQKIFKKLYDSGDIYKGSYHGKYCTPCEAFWTDTQLEGGKCPDCGREVRDAEEECYFFRLSKYADKIEKLLTETNFLQPPSRAKEMVNNFIKPGLADLAVSRTSVKWGIPVSFDEKHVVYVWIDALSNYINAMGFDCDGQNGQDCSCGGKADMRYWPADVHMVGKEIVRFHSIIWPALLMSLDLPLPKKVYGHGWLLLSGDKMSKSKGNVADPFVLVDRYGVDAVRYYLLREIPFGTDGAYTEEAFLGRTNSDLVNDLGNLVKRTIAMANQYFGGKVTAPVNLDSRDINLVNRLNELKDRTDCAIDGLSCSKALEEIFAAVSAANKYIDENAPWVLNKSGETDRLNAVIYNLLEAIRITATLLVPFLTRGTKMIFEMLNLPVPEDFSAATFSGERDQLDCVATGFGQVAEYNVGKDEVLYKRLDIKKELEYLDDLKGDAKTEGNSESASTDKKAKPAANTKKENSKENKNMEVKTDTKIEGKEEEKETALIGIDEFFKTELRVAEVVAAEKVEKADKLLKLTVRVGDSERVVVSGIAKSYTPEEMVGKRVVLVANLKPVKLRGIESFGMILCASCGDKVVLISPESVVDSGSTVS